MLSRSPGVSLPCGWDRLALQIRSCACCTRTCSAVLRIAHDQLATAAQTAAHTCLFSLLRAFLAASCGLAASLSCSSISRPAAAWSAVLAGMSATPAPSGRLLAAALLLIGTAGGVWSAARDKACSALQAASTVGGSAAVQGTAWTQSGTLLLEAALSARACSSALLSLPYHCRAACKLCLEDDWLCWCCTLKLVTCMQQEAWSR